MFLQRRPKTKRGCLFCMCPLRKQHALLWQPQVCLLPSPWHSAYQTALEIRNYQLLDREPTGNGSKRQCDTSPESPWDVDSSCGICNRFMCQLMSSGSFWKGRALEKQDASSRCVGSPSSKGAADCSQQTQPDTLCGSCHSPCCFWIFQGTRIYPSALLSGLPSLSPPFLA